MPRNAEVIRQWAILKEIERNRATGVTIDELSSRCAVTTRTIRRDLQALEEAGFPVFDDRSSDDGRTRWRLNGQPFKGLAAGLTLSELCALYFSRALAEALAGTPFRDDLESAHEKLASALPPHVRQFLDRLPRIIATKAEPQRRRVDPNAPGQADLVARLVEAIVQSRQVRMTYHSSSADQTKSYLVHPNRLAFAQGGLYLLAFVPRYGEVRTFAVERLLELSVLEERFTPTPPTDADVDAAGSGTAFPHSLGVHTGPPERVEIEFQPSVAPYIRARDWHPSQQLRQLPSGGLAMTLDVCVDQALRSWILGFGPSARVRSPEPLVRAITAELETARMRYN